MFTREQLRGIMPKTAEILDEFKQHFPGCKIVYAKEGGLEIGEPSKGVGVVPCISEPRRIETEEQKWKRLKEEAIRKKRKR